MTLESIMEKGQLTSLSDQFALFIYLSNIYFVFIDKNEIIVQTQYSQDTPFEVKNN